MRLLSNSYRKKKKKNPKQHNNLEVLARKALLYYS